VILLAGNGHVRLDYGVPSLLANRLQGGRLLTVGFLEPTPAAPSVRQPYDVTWTTPATRRADPCAAFPAARAAST
jgi:hypothetical protein